MVHCFPGWNFTLSGFLCLQRPLASSDSFYLSLTESAGSVRLLLPRLVKTTAPACLAPLVTSLRFTFLRAVCRLLPDTAARGRRGGGVIAALRLWLSKNFRGLNVVIVAGYRCHQLSAVSSLVLLLLSRCNTALISTFENLICHMLIGCAVRRQSGRAEQSSCKQQ